MKQYTHNQLVTGSNPAEECENQCHIIAEVTGSNPVSPTKVFTSCQEVAKGCLELSFQILCGTPCSFFHVTECNFVSYSAPLLGSVT